MNTASVPTFRYWGISFFWLFLGIACAAKKQYLCTVFVKLVYCMKKVHLSSPVAMRRNRFLVSCMAVCLSIGTSSGQAVDGVGGASTRVLAPADSLQMDSTNREVRSPGRTIGWIVVSKDLACFHWVRPGDRTSLSGIGNLV